MNSHYFLDGEDMQFMEDKKWQQSIDTIQLLVKASKEDKQFDKLIKLP